MRTEIRFKATRDEGTYAVQVPHATKAGYVQLIGYVSKAFGEIGGSGNAPVYGDYWTFTREGVESVGGWPTRQRAAEALREGWPTDRYVLDEDLKGKA